MKARLGALFKSEGEYTILEEWVLKTLEVKIKIERMSNMYLIVNFSLQPFFRLENIAMIKSLTT